jgi:competence protein ComEC
LPIATQIWQAPLVPAALAITAGIVADRYAAVSLPFSLAGVLVGLAAWAITCRARSGSLPLIYLAIAGIACGAAYHHWHRDVYAPDDIGNIATEDPRPVRLRGWLLEEPAILWQKPDDPLKSIPRTDPTRTVLGVTHLQQDQSWHAVTGRVSLFVAGHLQSLHAGDEVEIAGWLAAPLGPANPGEFDYASFLRDQRIRAQVSVRKTPEAVTRLAESWRGSLTGWLAVLRGWGQRQMQATLPAETSGVATALLLGEGSTLTTEDWEKYVRTGVIHVLAISGQHLVVLGWFLWTVFRVLGVRRRRGAVIVAVFLLAYALLVGGRPPVLRSAVTVCACCGGLLLGRPALSANSFALAWLTVALLNPTDLAGSGCQLSFLAVAVLYWGKGFEPRIPPDPLDQLADQTRPSSQKLLLWVLRQVAMSYGISLAIWLAAAPLVAARYHTVSPVGLLIGPPLVLLTSIALLSGFMLLMLAVICPPLVSVCGWVTHCSLAACELLVDGGERIPGGCWYVSDVADWWLWVFYLLLLAFLMVPPLRRRWRWGAAVGLAWLCVGLVSGPARQTPAELRITFLAVGHGGCTVLEAPDGRVLIYDAGSLGGPDVTRRQIAPFLWHRGIRRIDEVLLSHADLDHFNGLPALLQRFAIGQVTCTPTFADKTTAGVGVTLDFLRRHGIPVRTVHAGDLLMAGELQLEVLHPPAAGPVGNENTRSLVLRVRHRGHTILFTGDLEGTGLERVLALPPEPVDVLMAPHHGSRVANTPALATWARPRLVIACQGPPRGRQRPPDPYAEQGAHFLGTWPHGAITIRSNPQALSIETFASGMRFAVESSRELKASAYIR